MATEDPGAGAIGAHVLPSKRQTMHELNNQLAIITSSFELLKCANRAAATRFSNAGLDAAQRAATLARALGPPGAH